MLVQFDGIWDTIPGLGSVRTSKEVQGGADLNRGLALTCSIPISSSMEAFSTKYMEYLCMGGNASPFIPDLYLSWCGYCYLTKVVNTDYALAKLLSHNCRYLDDICTINLRNFDDSA